MSKENESSDRKVVQIAQPQFTVPLSLTSQFAFCGLPLRLDSYAGCSFACTYCFARLRGGNVPSAAVRPADPQSLQRILDRALGEARSTGILADFLRRRVPIHFGGMSDPFQPAEKHYGVTAAFLRALGEYNYPTVISTRSDLVATDRYVDLLRSIKKVVVQFSFSTSTDNVASRFEPSSSPPSQLLNAMSRLSAAGIAVTCRWQPYIPGISESPQTFVSRVAPTGCKHVALEHLKVPVEHERRLWRQLSDASGRDFAAMYRAAGAIRDGREFVLPAELKLPIVLQTAECARKAGMTFGAADNEFQYLSDTTCCCSGVDQFNGFENWFKHQIGYAVRKGIGRDIRYEAIAREWAPWGSIDRFLNSRSRLRSRLPCEGTIREHIRARWNILGSPSNPARFFNVASTAHKTAGGNRIYVWTKG